jgi:phytanoyl-CoA hydroxylase
VVAGTTTISAQEREFFPENGFLVVRDVFAPEELQALYRRLDALVSGRLPIPQGEKDGGRATGIGRLKPGAQSRMDPTTNPIEEVKLTERHARRGTQVYPLRQRPVDEAALRAALATGDPWNEITGIQHLADHDELFRHFAAHPNITAVLRELIGPHVKLFFDHAFNKPPYGGANRYHQDGFFMFTDRTVTCWIALDEVTTENGCMRYIPDTLGYGMFRFDELGEGITARELDQEVLVPLRPGDAVFHDRWTLHGTGPNDTPRGRRAWAVHYTSAKSRFVPDRTEVSGSDPRSYVQTPEREHWIGDYIYGNRHYQLVSGREFPGCV